MNGQVKGLTSIAVSGIWLRAEGDHVVVLAEQPDGNWVEVIREHGDGSFSHIVEPNGISRRFTEAVAKPETLE
jgi:hypothetical protein